MAEDAVTEVAGTVPVERSVFGLDEMRRPGEPERPFWTELPMGGDPVVVGVSTGRMLSNAPSHEALVELKVRDQPPPRPGPEFVPPREWAYTSGSGQVILCSLDGPELRIDLAADTAYVLRVWRKGGDSAAERFEELAGSVYPVTGLEEYRFLFTPVPGA
ncbi:Haze protective factor 1 [Streptomyces noboritoensis]|uniref:Haze protective factor 1 n=1 Tax=Streptomyces noboritoensis TaxID=67337 RepID=A0ABV6TCL6_9ACTN